MDTTIDKRKDQLSEINSFIEQVDKELTLVLQKFNWDRKHVLQGQEMVICKYDSNHRIPLSKRDTHEQQCFLTKHGYHKDDKFLPEPPLDSQFMIKFAPEEINQIIEDAARKDPLFKRGVRGSSPEPLTSDRLQCVYTPDERRALYDAVVAAAPTHHDEEATDLTLPGSSSKPRRVVKSREEVLAELRNMKRRRTKYRVAAKTKNYSDVLRDVIQTQMELYNEAVSTIKIKQEKNDDGYEDHGQTSYSQDFRPDKTNFVNYDNRRYTREHCSERYKEPSKRYDRDDRRAERNDRYRKEYERRIKVEKDDEWGGRTKNDEIMYRSSRKEGTHKEYERPIKIEKDDEWRGTRKNDESIDRSSRKEGRHKEYERQIKVEKGDEWEGRSKNDEMIDRVNSKERRQSDKYRAERSNREAAEYRTSRNYDESYKKQKERDEKKRSQYSDEREDKQSETSKDSSHKKHRKHKKKTKERDEEYYCYREDKDSSREHDRRSDTISKDKHERKRKHESQDYGHVSYYNQ